MVDKTQHIKGARATEVLFCTTHLCNIFKRMKYIIEA